MRDDLEPTRSPCSVAPSMSAAQAVWTTAGSSQACDLRIGECAIRGRARASAGRRRAPYDEGGPWSSRLAEEGARRVREVDVRGPDGSRRSTSRYVIVFVGERGRQESCMRPTPIHRWLTTPEMASVPCPAGGFRHGGHLAHGWPRWPRITRDGQAGTPRSRASRRRASRCGCSRSSSPRAPCVAPRAKLRGLPDEFLEALRVERRLLRHDGVADVPAPHLLCRGPPVVATNVEASQECVSLCGLWGARLAS